MGNWEEKQYLFTVQEALNALEKYGDDCIMVDIDVKEGLGYFPEFKYLGEKLTYGYETSWGNLQGEIEFGKRQIVMIDTSTTKGYKRNFIPEKTGKPNITDKYMTSGKLKQVFSQMNPKAVILKKNHYVDKVEGQSYMSPSAIMVYNNDSYKFVDEKGVPITMGIPSEKMLTFSFVGKHGQITSAPSIILRDMKEKI